MTAATSKTWDSVFFLLLACLSICDTCFSQSVRVEYELRKFTNAQGIEQDGKKCSLLGGSCSHKLTGYIDPSSPAKGWPGTKRVDDWPVIAQKKDNNLVLSKVISADVCAGGFRQADLRIHVTDSGMTSNKLVEDFDCISTPTVAPSELKATWSEEKNCQAKYNAGNNRLTYRVRAYNLPASSCGRPAARPN